LVNPQPVRIQKKLLDWKFELIQAYN
jgi:hypothetical protein